MAPRVPYALWPVFGLASPVLGPFLALKHAAFLRNRRAAEARNRERLEHAVKLELPALERVELKVVVDWRAREGFRGEAGVSWLFRSERGALLMDVGFGDEGEAFPHNASRLGLRAAELDALLITHLHLDHMGGMAAQRARRFRLPRELGEPRGELPVYLPDACSVEGPLRAERLGAARLLPGGFASTGPMARALFFFGMMEEQALLARLRGKGLLVFTGCGHPTLPVILERVRALSDEPIYAVGGGLHLPLSESRCKRMGIEVQQLFGTGKPPWEPLGEAELRATLDALREARPRRVLLSAHDTCDRALERLAEGLPDSRVEVVEAGATYEL